MKGIENGIQEKNKSRCLCKGVQKIDIFPSVCLERRLLIRLHRYAAKVLFPY